VRRLGRAEEDGASSATRSCISREPYHLAPPLKAVRQHRAIAPRGQHVPAGADVAANRLNAGEEVLCLLGGF
jgi:hypothetical protein